LQDFKFDPIKRM